MSVCSHENFRGTLSIVSHIRVLEVLVISEVKFVVGIYRSSESRETASES